MIKRAIETNRAVLTGTILSAVGLIIDSVLYVFVEAGPIKISLIVNFTYFFIKTFFRLFFHYHYLF